ncbi:PREDICTED: uncharacterized protein LOC102006539 isoform X2 [Chinchilla lanigera]|uniref:uncharacterized protein LOC102006539 isoform X2 n=1 Tax=Chinchilla lanigera TaxID=34839 RepID=UPI00038EF202|nr:PREDICTED: uncharacterized protein LOC102006539 isoform X2 [Chinchilla lanigera]
MTGEVTMIITVHCSVSDQFFTVDILPNRERKMSNRGPSLTFLLLFIFFFRDSFCICDGTTWTKAGWEIFPEEVHYQKVKPAASQCLPYPLDRLFCSFANKDILHSCLHLTLILAQALFIILSVLSVHYLWMKWKKHQKKLKKQASLGKLENGVKGPSFYDVDQILCTLLTTSSMINKYLDQMSQQSKEVKQQKLKMCKEPARGKRF